MTDAPPFAEFLSVLLHSQLNVSIADRVALAQLLSSSSDCDLATLEQRMMYVVAHSRDDQIRFRALFRQHFLVAPPVKPGRRVEAPPLAFRSPYWVLAIALVLSLASGYAIASNRVRLLDRFRSHLEAAPVTPNTPIATKPSSPSSPSEAADAPVVLRNEAHTAPSKMIAVDRRVVDPTLAGAVGLPLLAGVIAVLWLRRRRRYPKVHAPYTFELRYPESPALAIDHLALEELASIMGGASEAPVVGELDVARTAIATARSGGLPMPTWARRRAAHRHLVLLTSDPRLRGPRAHFEALLDALQAHGVACERYEYAASPSRVSHPGSADAAVYLETLHGQFDALSVLGDPDAAIELGSGEPAQRSQPLASAWLEATKSFGTRTWLCPSAGMCKSAGAQLLTRQGWQVGSLEVAVGSTEAVRAARPHTDRANASNERQAARFYEWYLGEAFPLLCAATLLPDLSHDGVAHLAHSLNLKPRWSRVARLLGIPWLLDGVWPAELEHALRSELYARHAHLAEQVEAHVAQLLNEQRPASGSAAEATHRAIVLEQRLKTNENAGSVLEGIGGAPELLRDRLRRSGALPEALRHRPLMRLRLTTFRTRTVVVATVLAACAVTVVATRHLQARVQGAKHAVEELETTNAAKAVSAMTGTVLSACWKAHAKATVAYLDANATPVEVPITVAVSSAGALAPALSRTVSTAFDMCLAYGYKQLTLPVRVPRKLSVTQQVTFVGLSAQIIHVVEETVRPKAAKVPRGQAGLATPRAEAPRAARAPEEPFAPDAGTSEVPLTVTEQTKYFIVIGALADRSGRTAHSVDSLVHDSMTAASRSLPNSAVAPASELEADSKGRLTPFPKVKSIFLSPRLAPLDYSNGNLKVKLEVAMFTYPNKQLIGNYSVTLTQQGVGTPDREKEDDLIRDTATRAMENFAVIAPKFP
jgi:hypothetical protein